MKSAPAFLDVSTHLRAWIPIALMAVAATLPAQEPDWPSAHKETLANLREMIRMNTVNPPGNEIQVGRYLDSALKSAGIESRLFEPAPGRAAVVARLKGNGSKQPVIIMGHMDVVGVERAKWSMDPFAAEVRDGYLYGRGSIDDKGMLAVNLETMLLLKRNVIDKGGTLSRDVIFVANSDEEAGGVYGMGWLIEHHPELIRAEFALNEGGRTRIVNGKLLYVAVQNTEKVSHVLNLTAHGPGGHASIPLEGNVILRLGRALAKISGHTEPLYLTPTTREFFSQLGRVWQNREEKRAMADVASTDTRRQQRGAKILSKTPVFNAVMRTGVSATMLEGGIRTNVIPTDATAKLNVRTLPGQSLDAVITRLRKVVGDPLVDITIASRGEDSPASNFHSPMFDAIRESAQALEPSIAVVPYLSTGATDSARLRTWGIQSFGVLAFPMNQNDEDRMHGNEERVPLASVEWATKMIYGAVLRVAR